MYITFRVHLPLIFTEDKAVAALVTLTLPLVGVMTFFDGVGVAAHGLLRGIGKQSIGGPANLVAYYLVSLPRFAILRVWARPEDRRSVDGLYHWAYCVSTAFQTFHQGTN